MSREYDNYLIEHRKNVSQAYHWLLNHNLLYRSDSSMEDYYYIAHNCTLSHDETKNLKDEYEAYDAYFYSNNRSYETMETYKHAWLLHIQRNPHHWQHWVLIHDEPEEKFEALEMPFKYIVEMICDWWSFSWQKGDLYEVFKWYDEHKSHILLGVETILDSIKEKLEVEADENL